MNKQNEPAWQKFRGYIPVLLVIGVVFFILFLIPAVPAVSVVLVAFGLLIKKIAPSIAQSFFNYFSVRICHRAITNPWRSFLDWRSAEVRIRLGDGSDLLSVSPLRVEARKEAEEPKKEFALNPYHRFVPLIGREDKLSSLESFLSSSKSVSICVLTGTSGSDKERLALEFSLKAQQQGWRVGYLQDQDLEKIRNPSWSHDSLRWNNPTLLVVENAMPFTDPLKKLIRALLDPRTPSKSKLRVLLLAREANRESGWLNDLFMRYSSSAESIHASEILDPTQPLELTSLKMQDRLQLLRETLKRCGSTLQISETPEFMDKLSKIEWSGEPLFLIMAALRMAETGLPDVLSLKHRDLADHFTNTLRVELDKAARASGVDPELLGHFVACLALAGEMDQEAFREFYGEEVVRMGWQNAVVSSKIEGILRHFLGADPQNISQLSFGFPKTIAGSLFLKLLYSDSGKTALLCYRRFGNVVLESIIACVQERDTEEGAKVALLISWLKAIQDDIREDDEKLKDFAFTLPDESLHLNDFALQVWEDLSNRLRKVAEEDRDTFLPDLAMSLNNLGNRLSDVGRLEEALDVAQEAVKHRRELTNWNRNAFLSNLATSLSNLGIRLSEVGRREEALDATQEAVKYDRELTERNRDAFLLDLAISLNNLGNRLSEVGRREEALDAAQEAVKYRRELTERSRGTFLPDLAGSLNNLGNRLSEVGRLEEALAATQEAVKYYRELTERNRDAFLPDLAISLNNLGNRLREVGQRKEALDATQEAMKYYRELTERNRDAFLPDLALSVGNLAIDLRNLNREEEAAAAKKEAQELRDEMEGKRKQK